MEKPKKWFWLREGWNWIDRAFFYPATVIALAIAFGFLLWALRPAKWGPEAWSAAASWVQAVGSIAAIAAGFVVVRFQLAEQRREATERSAEFQRAQCSRAFQILAARMKLCVVQLDLFTSTVAIAKQHPHLITIVSAPLERSVDVPNDPAFTPAILLILGALQAKSASIVHMAESYASRGQPISDDVIETFNVLAAGMKDDMNRAQRWAEAELEVFISPEERAQKDRLLPYFEDQGDGDNGDEAAPVAPQSPPVESL